MSVVPSVVYRMQSSHCLPGVVMHDRSQSSQAGEFESLGVGSGSDVSADSEE